MGYHAALNGEIKKSFVMYAFFHFAFYYCPPPFAVFILYFRSYSYSSREPEVQGEVTVHIRLSIVIVQYIGSEIGTYAVNNT